MFPFEPPQKHHISKGFLFSGEINNKHWKEIGPKLSFIAYKVLSKDKPEILVFTVNNCSGYLRNKYNGLIEKSNKVVFFYI